MPYNSRAGYLTIRRQGKETVNDPSALALAALGWVLTDERRAQRFLDLTGLSPDSLRNAIGECATHRAVFDFLAQHEPDLVAAADALDMAPEELARVGEELRR